MAPNFDIGETAYIFHKGKIRRTKCINYKYENTGEYMKTLLSNKWISVDEAAHQASTISEEVFDVDFGENSFRTPPRPLLTITEKRKLINLYNKIIKNRNNKGI